MKEIYRERFEAWLWSQPAERIIEAGEGSRCVLCSFLKETTHLKNAYFLGWRSWSPDIRSSLAFPLPEWAVELINPAWLQSFTNPSLGYPVTVAVMQRRYLELFPEARESCTAMSEPAIAAKANA